MSDGTDYGAPWQRPVGWLGSHVPQVAPEPLIDVAAKLAYHMDQAERHRIRLEDERRSRPEDAPGDRVYIMDGARGFHQCEIDRCGALLHGVFGWRTWKFPAGIVHYLVRHGWQPPVDFLAELAALPDPPTTFDVLTWLAASPYRGA